MGPVFIAVVFSMASLVRPGDEDYQFPPWQSLALQARHSSSNSLWALHLTRASVPRYTAFDAAMGIFICPGNFSIFYMGFCIRSKLRIAIFYHLILNEWMIWQLLDVLNAHFQTVFGISKLQSTLLQFAYFVCYIRIIILSFHPSLTYTKHREPTSSSPLLPEYSWVYASSNDSGSFLSLFIDE